MQSYGACILHIISWWYTFAYSFKKISLFLSILNKYITGIIIFKVQRAITPKVGKPELWLLNSAPCLMTLYICVKFCQNIWNGFQLTEQIWEHGRNGYVQCSKDTSNSKCRQTRVSVNVFCMLSHNALHLCEVLWKYFKLYILLWSGH